tara:strand:- start:87 stop:239 length:153 start_codon:yes stop_codon:yes gene_type:complete
MIKVKQLKTPKGKALYIHHLVKDSEALDIMLKRGLIGKNLLKFAHNKSFV